MTQKSKNSLITFLIVLSALAMCFAGCQKSPIPGDSVHQFKKGDILLPTYVNTDTLVVIAPEMLNEMMKNEMKTSDEDINEIISECTVTLEDYQDYILTVGK